MKLTSVIAFFFGTILVSPALFASSSSCNSIQNKDSRYMCKAQAEGKPSHCNSIQDKDTRYMCKAIVEGRSSHCNSIQNRDQRYMCKSNF